MNQALKTKTKPVLQKLTHLNLEKFKEETLFIRGHPEKTLEFFRGVGGLKVPMLQENRR